MAVVDTSILVPAFDAEHPRHPEAVERLAAQDVLRVPSLVLAEFTTILRTLGNKRGLDGGKLAREALAYLLAKPGILECQTYDAAAAVTTYTASKSLSYTDAVGVVVARQWQEDLLSLDQGQVRALRKPPM